MKKIYLVCLMCFYFIINNNKLFAQDFEFSIGLNPFTYGGNTIGLFYGGSGSTTVTNLTPVDKTTELGANIMGAYFYPFYKFSDKMTLGGYAGLSFFISLPSASPMVTDLVSGTTISSGGLGSAATGADLPHMICFRYGEHSSSDDYDGFGVGVGVGGMLSTFKSGYGGVTGEGTFYKPAFQLTVGYNNVSATFISAISGYQTYYKTSTGNIPKLKYSFFNLDLTLAL